MRHEQVLDLARANLNDVAGTYDNEVLLPYYNLARMGLEQIFELNNIPVTAEQSDVINVPAGTTAVGFDTTPALPTNLIDIQELWESQEGQDVYTRVVRKSYLPPPMNVERVSFGIYTWQDQEIRILSSIVDIDLKIDYIKSLFSLLALSNLNSQNVIRNTDLFLAFRTAALVVDIIEEDVMRAAKLDGEAAGALQTSLGISVKGMQAITTRRRPFRAAFKMRRGIYR